MSKNAVLTQIWIAMITYLLLAFARHSARAGWTVQRIMRVIQLNLYERRSLKDILIPDPPRQKTSVSLPRERFWDIPVSKINSHTRQPIMLQPSCVRAVPLQHRKLVAASSPDSNMTGRGARMRSLDTHWR